MSEFNIVQIQQALPGLPITGGFIIDTLGVKPARTEKRALWWNSSDWPLICKRLTEHVAKGAKLDLSTLSGERPKKVEAPAPAPVASDDAEFFGDTTIDEANGEDMFDDTQPGDDDMFE
jgi:hypothetical protein